MVVLNIFIRLKLFIVTIKKREYVVVQPSPNYMGSIFYAPFVQHENAEPARVSIRPSKARVKCSV